MIFPLAGEVYFTSAPTFHVYKFYRSRNKDNIIFVCSYYPELVYKWNGKKRFSRKEEESLLRLKLRSSRLLRSE